MLTKLTTGDEQKDRVDFIAKIAGFIFGTGRVLECLGLPRISFTEPGFRPYLVVFEQLTEEMCLEKSGLEALRTFTDIWDDYCQVLRAQGKDPFDNVMEVAIGKCPFFSAPDVSLMLGSIAESKRWLQRHFPEACAYG
jgi:hypothetical protein